MRIRLPTRSRYVCFAMPTRAIALLFCVLLIEPLFAQEVDWAYFGNDVNNSRYAAIDQINPSNISQLKAAWNFTGDATEAVSAEATPIVVDGVMYISGNNSGVFALNPATGKQIWHYTPSPAVTGLNLNRGVAYGQGLIFLGRSDAALVALNAKTGAVAWTTPVDPASPFTSITFAPQYVVANEGKQAEVIVGVEMSDWGIRGHVDAYNPATGKLLWRFYTTEPNSWAGDSYLLGGGDVWQTPTFDPTLNMVYFGTGNAGPDYMGADRAGANLYTSSVVALDATTGELQWFFKMIHHGLWDFDCAQPTVLFSWNGIPAIEGNTKAGFMFILDRASGESLFPYQEVAVPPTPANAAFQHPWPTQPVSSIESLVELTVEPWEVPARATAAAEFTTPGPTPGVYQPAELSGIEWPPAAYSPRTNMIYSHAIYNPSVFAFEPANTPNCGMPNYNFDNCGLDSNAYAALGPTVNNPSALVTSELSVLGVEHGVFGAINALTGKVAWTIPILTSAPRSGVTVAGDLVFFGDTDGLFYGASAATGEILWVFDAATVPGAGGAGSTGAAVYEIGGVEYVAYEFGGGGLLNGNALVAFALPSAKTTATAVKAKTK